MPESTNPDLKAVLAYDSLTHAEEILGRTHREDPDAVGDLGLLLIRQNAAVRDAELFLAGDTNNFTQTPEQWFDVVRKMGFEKILEDPIPRGQFNTKNIPEACSAWWRDGVLLWVDEFCGRVNSAHAYLFYTLNCIDDWAVLGGCTHGPLQPDNSNPVSKDARVGFKLAMADYEAHGTIHKQWPCIPHLWLLHHQDTKAEGYDYKAITTERITRFPECVQKVMSFIP